MMLSAISLLFWVGRVISLVNKNKVFKVNLLVSPTYLKLYEQTHTSLGVDLQNVALTLASAFNNSTMAKSNGYTIAFELFTPLDTPFINSLEPQICEGSVTNILDLLNDINRYNNTSHFIALLPCHPKNFGEVFTSAGLDVPIIDYSTGIECAKRVAVLLESNFTQLLSSFSNALLKIIGGSQKDFNVITESSSGDDGLKVSITLNDDTVYNILHSTCFLNS